MQQLTCSLKEIRKLTKELALLAGIFIPTLRHFCFQRATKPTTSLVAKLLGSFDISKILHKFELQLNIKVFFKWTYKGFNPLPSLDLEYWVV